MLLRRLGSVGGGEEGEERSAAGDAWQVMRGQEGKGNRRLGRRHRGICEIDGE